MSTTVAELNAKLTADTSNFKQEFTSASEHAGQSLEKILVSSELIAHGMEMAFEVVGEKLGEVFKHFQEVQEVSAATNARLAATHEAAGMTAESISKLSTAIEAKTGIEATSIQSGENVLLGFTRIKDGANGMHQEFTKSTQVMADLGTAMGGNMAGAAQILGRALSDPEQAASRLMRQGIILTAAQKDQIKAFQQSGDAADAQGVILDAISAKYGGMAEAAGMTLTGGLKKLEAQFMRIADAGGGATDLVTNGVQMAARAVTAFADVVEEKGIGEALAGMFPPPVEVAILAVSGALVAGMIPAMLTTAATSLGVSEALVGSLIPDLVLVGGAMLEAGAAFVAAQIPMIPFYLAGAAVAGVAALIIENWGPISSFFQGVFQQIGGALAPFAKEFIDEFHAISDVVGKVAGYIHDTLGALFNMLPAPVKAAIGGIGETLGKLPGMAAGAFNGAKDAVGGFVSALTTHVPIAAHTMATAVDDNMAHATKAVKAHKAAMHKLPRAYHAAKVKVDEMTASYGKLQEALALVNARHEVMGDSVDVYAGQLSALQSHLESLIAKHPTWTVAIDQTKHAVDDLKAAHEASIPAYEKAATSMATFGQSIGSVTGPISSLQGGVNQMLAPLGVGLPSALTGAMNGALGMANGLATVYGATATLIPMIATATTAITAKGGADTAAAIATGWGTAGMIAQGIASGVVSAAQFVLSGALWASIPAWAAVAGGIAAATGGLSLIIPAVAAVGAGLLWLVGQAHSTTTALAQVSQTTMVMADGIDTATEAQKLARTVWSAYGAATTDIVAKHAVLGASYDDTTDRIKMTTDAMMTYAKAGDTSSQSYQGLARDLGNLNDKLAETTRQADAAKVAAANLASISSAMGSGIDNALKTSIKGFLAGGIIADLQQGLMDGVKSAIVDGVIQAAVQGAVMKGAIGKLLDTLTSDLSAGNTSGATSVIAQIGAAIPGVASTLATAMAPLQAAIASAFGSSATTASASAASAPTTPTTSAASSAPLRSIGTNIVPFPTPRGGGGSSTTASVHITLSGGTPADQAQALIDELRRRGIKVG